MGSGYPVPKHLMVRWKMESLSCLCYLSPLPHPHPKGLVSLVFPMELTGSLGLEWAQLQFLVKGGKKETKIMGLADICLELVGWRAKKTGEETDWRGTWLEIKMIGEENEFETIGTWSGHRKLRKGRKAHHFPESLGSWFLANKTQKMTSLLPTSLSLPTRLQSEELSGWWGSVIDGDYLQESDSLFLHFLCFDCLSFFFFSELRTYKELNHPKIKDSLNPSFLSHPKQIASPFYKALLCFVILIMIMIIMRPYTFIMLHAFQGTFTYLISFDFLNNYIKAGKARGIISIDEDMKRLNYVFKVIWLINDRIYTIHQVFGLGVQFSFYLYIFCSMIILTGVPALRQFPTHMKQIS